MLYRKQLRKVSSARQSIMFEARWEGARVLGRSRYEKAAWDKSVASVATAQGAMAAVLQER
jgi:hypothetical protein